MFKITITENESNQRVDRFLKKYLDNAPLSMIYKIIRKDLKVNGKRVKEDTILNVGDELTLYILDSEIESFRKRKNIVKAKKQFKIAYEDENILIVEKPFGLLTHGDSKEKKNHLTNQVLDYLIEKKEYNPRTNLTFVPSPVNRLDRNTTGLVIFGKNALSLQSLNKIIKDKDEIKKEYLTIVSGKVQNELKLTGNMTKDEHNNTVKVSKDTDGKYMETIVTPLEYGSFKGKDYSLLNVRILTGRTHQIRAQLGDSGYYLIGDQKYGNKEINKVIQEEFKWTTQLLHAYKLTFDKIEDEKLKYLSGKVITSSLPKDFERIKEVIFNGQE